MSTTCLNLNESLACVIVFSAQAALQGVSGTGKRGSCTGRSSVLRMLQSTL